MAAKFELKAAQGGKFVFNLKATNGQVILSSEIYESKKAAEKGIESVRKNAATDGHSKPQKAEWRPTCVSFGLKRIFRSGCLPAENDSL